MNDAEKKSIWSIRNEIVKWCSQAIKNLARQDYKSTVSDIDEIKSNIETFYKENAN